MKPFAVGKHHRGPGITGLTGWLEVFKGEREWRWEAGIFGQPSGEGIVLSIVRNDYADFLFSDQGEQLGKMTGGGVSGFGRAMF